MAIFPIILVNSATGSDTLASGAGPATAKTGTAAATDGVNGKTVTITDAAMDLSTVATDGSAAIYIADATAGHRNFDQITAITGSIGNWTVTVANGFSLSLAGKSWAIGGVRASVAGAVSLRLFDNNTAAGDAMPGWIEEMQSGHSENIGAPLNMRRSGDTTGGPIKLRGAAGASTLPLLTFTADGDGIILRGSSQQLSAFELQNSAATKTLSRAIVLTTGGGVVIEAMKIDNAAKNFWKGVDIGGVNGCRITLCDIGHTASVGIDNACAGGIKIVGNWIHDTGAIAGIRFQAGVFGYSSLIYSNVFYNCAGTSLIYENSRGDGLGGCTIAHNTFDTSATDAIQTTTAAASLMGLDVFNNIFSHSGAYGLEFNNASFTDAFIAAYAPFIRGNDTYLNTSGAYKSATGTYTASNCPWASGDPALDPGYASISTSNAMIGTNLKAQAWPLGGIIAVGTYGTTYSYVDIGAAQRQEAGGGGGGGVIEFGAYNPARNVVLPY